MSVVLVDVSRTWGSLIAENTGRRTSVSCARIRTVAEADEAWRKVVIAGRFGDAVHLILVGNKRPDVKVKEEIGVAAVRRRQPTFVGCRRSGIVGQYLIINVRLNNLI